MRQKRQASRQEKFPPGEIEELKSKILTFYKLLLCNNEHWRGNTGRIWGVFAPLPLLLWVGSLILQKEQLSLSQLLWQQGWLNRPNYLMSSWWASKKRAKDILEASLWSQSYENSFLSRWLRNHLELAKRWRLQIGSLKKQSFTTTACEQNEKCALFDTS